MTWTLVCLSDFICSLTLLLIYYLPQLWTPFSTSPIHQSLLCLRISYTSVFSFCSSFPLVISNPGISLSCITCQWYFLTVSSPTRAPLHPLFYFHLSTYLNMQLCTFSLTDWQDHFQGCKLYKAGTSSIAFSNRISSTWHIVGTQQRLLKESKHEDWFLHRIVGGSKYRSVTPWISSVELWHKA